MSLKLSPDFPFYQSTNDYKIASIQEFLQKEIDVLEKAFNARNENDYFTKKREKIAELVNLVDNLQLNPSMS